MFRSRSNLKITMAHHLPSGEVGHQEKFAPYHLFKLRTCHLGPLCPEVRLNMPSWPSRFSLTYVTRQVGSSRFFTHRLCHLGPPRKWPMVWASHIGWDQLSPGGYLLLHWLCNILPIVFFGDSLSRQLSLGREGGGYHNCVMPAFSPEIIRYAI